METTREITKLCEAWWERLANSTKADHRKYSEHFLELLGWPGVAAVDAAPEDAPASRVSYLLRAGGQSAVAAHFVMPGSLEPPSSLVERGLDFCDTTRLLVNGTRKWNINYAFITDLFRSYLYDAQTDELLLWCDTAENFDRDFAKVLTRTAIERGALEEVRRQPRSHSARQLREWFHHWCGVISGEGELSKETTVLAVDRLLVLRYLFDHDILKRSGWRLRARFSELVSKAFSSNPRGVGKMLTSLYHDISFDWKAEIFKPVPELDQVLENDSIAAPMLREFALLSKTKFTVATILESFNYGEAAEKARVRLVPEPDEERMRYLGKQTLNTIDTAALEIDLCDEGYRAIFHWFDRLVGAYDRLGAEFDSEAYHQQAVVGEIDLFEWSELDSNRPGAVSDRYQHAIEKGLNVYYMSPRQYRTARLLLYLHVISCYAQSKQRFVQFPHVETALKERPKVLESDRKWIYRTSTSEGGGDGWDVI